MLLLQAAAAAAAAAEPAAASTHTAVCRRSNAFSCVEIDGRGRGKGRFVLVDGAALAWAEVQ
jgi:hypothetical protein